MMTERQCKPVQAIQISNAQSYLGHCSSTRTREQIDPYIHSVFHVSSQITSKESKHHRVSSHWRVDAVDTATAEFWNLDAYTIAAANTLHAHLLLHVHYFS